MITQTEKFFADMVALAVANFPNMQGKDMRPTRILWEKSLSDLPPELIEKAVIRALSEKQFWPTVADIRYAAEQLCQSDMPDAITAWTEVQKKLNPYVKPEWSHPTISQAVKAMGFMNLCQSDRPEIDRAQFLKIYDTVVKREKNSRLNAQVENLVNMAAKKLSLERGK